jgi:Transposase DDE domain group 1
VFLANAAWLVVATLAHNLLRWTATIGLGSADLVVAKTLRRLLALPGRLTRSARRRLLHLPTDWPWATQFLGALTRLRAVPLRA